MSRRSCSWWVTGTLALALPIAGCAEADEPANQGAAECERVDPDFTPELVETACSVPMADTGQTTCGVLRIAEDAGVESCVLEIAWARYKPESASVASPAGTDGPPLFLLGGGPGSPLLAHMEQLVALGDAVAPGRVVVAHDARGSGLSTPPLDCLQVQFQADSEETAQASWQRACAEQMAQRGHHAERYRTPVLADDVVALADALAMPRIDLLGASYGSRLAHVLATKHPRRVRAVVLDAATPVDTPLLERMAGNLRRAWKNVVEDCRAQSECDGAHGDLQAKLDSIFEALTETPAQVATPGGETPVGPQVFASLLASMLANETLIPSAPAIVSAVAAGDMAPLETVLAAAVMAPPAVYMHHAIMCSEELPHNDRKRAAADLASFPHLASRLPYDALHETCDALGLTDADGDLADTPPIEQPTLALTGRYDWLSPARNWEDVERRLPQGTLWEIGDAGHGGRKTPCGEATVAAFLKDPDKPVWPDCLAEVQAATFLADLIDPDDLD